jgi:hypothetical protein
VAGEVTQLVAGGRPGAYYEVGDKTPAYWTRDDESITQLVAGGRPGGYFAILDKAESSADTKHVTDTYRPVLTFGQVTQYDIEVSDKYVPVLTMSGLRGSPSPLRTPTGLG